MENTFFHSTRFKQMPVIGIIRNLSLKDIEQILPLYYVAGLTTIEITMNTPNASQMIRYATKLFGDKLYIGAGTVCTSDDLEKAITAGSRFIVTPILNKEVIKTCIQKQVPIFPGAFTPTEIYTAWSWGAEMVKVFPVSQLGSSFIKELGGPLSQIKLLPTGGINLNNCIDFMQAGAAGLGIGSQIFDHNLIENKNWNGLKELFISFVNKLSNWYMNQPQ